MSFGSSCLQQHNIHIPSSHDIGAQISVRRLSKVLLLNIAYLQGVAVNHAENEFRAKREAIADQARMHRECMLDMLKRRGDHTYEDEFDNIGKPFQFRGEETTYKKWMVKYLAYTHSHAPQNYKYTKSATVCDKVVAPL